MKRPVNIDPGYINESRLILASTKDFSHRIYLRDGIYAEVTLNYRKRQIRDVSLDVSGLQDCRLP